MAKYFFHGGRVYTANPRSPLCTAVAVVGRKVLAAGSEQDVASVVDDSFIRIDLSGRTLVPAFTDAHIHFMYYAMSMIGVDLIDTTGPEHVAELVAKAVPTTPQGAWITGVGWNSNTWPQGKQPDRSYLDAVAPHTPVALWSKDLHSLWANTAALRLARIGLDTPDPDGGRIVRDPDTRQATGLLNEKAAFMVANVMPEVTQSQLVEAMQRAQAVLHSMGIGCIHNMDGGLAFAALQQMKRERKLKLRVVQAIPAASLDAAVDLGLSSGFGDDWIVIGQLKAFADGSLGSHTAHMLKPYEDTENDYGIEVTPKEEMAKLVGRAVLNNIGCAIHAIGDRANRDILDIFDSVKEDSAARRLTHRIEHVQLLHPNDVRRLADLGVVASMQPVHVLGDIRIADLHWGGRSRWAYAFKSLARSGATLAFGSDAPVETPDPLRGLYAAVIRKEPGSEAQFGWYPEERLTVEETLRAYTVGAARAAGLPAGARRSTIVPGALADLAILSQDLFAMPMPDFLEIRVDATMINGEFVFERGHAR
ncbi:MAG: N-substituted formamide deformylase precursor [Firmicutes bacterium ADurb.Bin506]|nr:MAG: N-substituted formamide deformylase precursor [Firmicutes bacterium ADurb.Bin506]